MFCFATAAVAAFRGDHWLVREDDAEICIGEPAAEWLDHQDRAVKEKAEKYAAGISIGIGIATVFMPILLAEIRLAQEKRYVQSARTLAQSQPGAPVATGQAPLGRDDERFGGDQGSYGDRGGHRPQRQATGGLSQDLSSSFARRGGQEPDAEGSRND